MLFFADRSGKANIKIWNCRYYIAQSEIAGRGLALLAIMPGLIMQH